MLLYAHWMFKIFILRYPMVSISVISFNVINFEMGHGLAWKFNNHKIINNPSIQ